MISNKRLNEYNKLIESRFTLGKEIEKVSYELLSINLSEAARE